MELRRQDVRRANVLEGIHHAAKAGKFQRDEPAETDGVYAAWRYLRYQLACE